MFRQRRGPTTISTRNLWPKREPIAWHEIIPDLMAIFGFFAIIIGAAILANWLAPYMQLGTFLREVSAGW